MDKTPEKPKADVPGKTLSHAETLQWIHEQKAWRRARKTKPIWARELEPDEIDKSFTTVDHAKPLAECSR